MGGCASTATVPTATGAAEHAEIEKLKASISSAERPLVAIIYYSTYGHTRGMADEVRKGLEAGGATVHVYQAAETLPEEVLLKMGAPPKPPDAPVMSYAKVALLPEYDGLVFGIPTRFGSMAGQMKAFFDMTGGLWQQGKLVGKPAATFVSSATQNGGQETTHLTTLTNLVHHGMLYVPLGYQAGADGQFDLTAAHGGAPWGAGMLAGADGSRQASAKELAIALKQGQSFAGTVKRTLQKPADRVVKIAIVYYSMYGHVKKLADHIAAAAREEGAQVDVYQVPETLHEEVLTKMRAAAKANDAVMDHAAIEKLPEYDGIMFGIPTRFGMMAAQVKAFFDATGGLWKQGKLVGKLAATFVSTATQNGGQETTHLTAATQLAHHGMVYVPLGYQAGSEGQFDLTEAHGGSPYGAGTLAAGDGSRQPSEFELKVAAKQGQVFAAKAKQMAQ